MERIITEGLDLPTRTIVRDIIKIVRTGEVGSYELPLELSGEDHYKHDLNVYFDWNKEWKENNQKYFVDGNYDDESETMQVVLFINEVNDVCSSNIFLINIWYSKFFIFNNISYFCLICQKEPFE